ncbi:MAG: thiamine-phosphate kinase [Candidatus Omnitrophica bacterium]|nr:thiamine-phosphate kinase [Candidatus Omnitrophota bacterium]
MNEFSFIDSIKPFQNLSCRVIKGIGDDAAVLELDAKRYQLLTTDMLVEGVHFLSNTPAKLVGHKALACNISDIAAMGGIPTFAVVSIGIPTGTGHIEFSHRVKGQENSMCPDYVSGIYKGIFACAKRFGVSIVGGDTVKADKLVINIALLGEVEKKNLVLRSGAKPGDHLFVSGPLGGTLKSGKHLNFTPRVKEARFLIEQFKPSAMMDISDGLAGDLGHILNASRVGAEIDEQRLPLNKGVSVDEALHGGEDFELLFSLSSPKSAKLVEYLRSHRCGHFVEIGRIIALPKKLYLCDGSGRRREIEPKGYTHF